MYCVCIIGTAALNHKIKTKLFTTNKYFTSGKTLHDIFHVLEGCKSYNTTSVMFINPNVDNIIIMYHNYNRHCKLFNKLILRLSGWCFHIY